MILTDTATLGQSRPGSNGSKEVTPLPWVSWLDPTTGCSLGSYPGSPFWGGGKVGYILLQEVQSAYSKLYQQGSKVSWVGYKKSVMAVFLWEEI